MKIQTGMIGSPIALANGMTGTIECFSGDRTEVGVRINKENGLEWVSLDRLKKSGDREPWAEIRHEATSYDYEWQTGKYSRDDAKAYWTEKFRQHEAELE